MKAFISSTSKDLGDYRQAAYEVCNRLAIVPVGMELFESMGAGATDGSRRKLDEADVYVGIFANRYGFIEPGYDRAVTELEFDHAEQRRLERLCFVADDNAQLPADPANQDKLAAFKARVDLLIRNTFGSPWEFKYKLYDTLLKWLFRQPRAGPLMRDAFAPLFADYARFAGRGEILKRIQAFIDSPESGYLVVTAPAGYGKTALAVKLVELNREITAYHFFTTLYGSDAGSEFLSEAFFLKNVVEQIRLWTFLPFDAWQAPTTLSGWVSAYHNLLAAKLGERRVLVLDGLDEVKAWRLHPYLSVVPGANLKVIVTVRDVGQAWAEEYDFPKAHVRSLAVGGLAREDVRQVLRAAGSVAAAFSGDGGLLDKVVAVTSPLGTVAGADPLYVTCLADDIEAGQVTAGNIAQQPARLEEYLQRWWGAIVAQAGQDNATLDLLGTLAAQLGPIRREELISIHASLKPSWTADPIDKALGNLRRTVAGSAQTGYSFAHPRFRDYVRRYPEVRPYEAKLLAYCVHWRENKGRYALAYGIRHLAQAGSHEAVFKTVLDPAFQSAQKQAFGSVLQTLRDLAAAIEIACDASRFVDVLRCAVAYRKLSRTEGVAEAVFKAVNGRRFAAAASAAAGYGFGAKTSSAWILALRCYLVWAAAEAGERDAAVSLADSFERQLGLSFHGASLHTSPLCDALIAGAVVKDQSLAEAIGLDPGWAAAIAGALVPPVLALGEQTARLRELDGRIGSLEVVLGENPSLVEFIDEERAGDYTVKLRDALVEVARDPQGGQMIDRALAVVFQNPYPRYRDNALVALGIAALAVPDPEWTGQRIERILETALEKEGLTFTFDVAAQLVAEAERRGLPGGALAAYLDKAGAWNDRWGTRLRVASARAAARFAQGGHAEASAALEAAAGLDQGFAGYVAAHLLALAARWCEFGRPERIAELDLVAKSRTHAERVRDPKFAVERGQLVNEFERWLVAPPPNADAVSAVLRATPDPDTRRAFKDLVSARWLSGGQWLGWKHLVLATLADATALDFVLGRLTAHAVREHREGARELSDAELNDAMALCAEGIATSRAWEVGTPMYG